MTYLQVFNFKDDLYNVLTQFDMGFFEPSVIGGGGGGGGGGA